MPRARVLTLVGLFLSATPVLGQTARVLVMDPATYNPSTGGYVLLLDTADAEAARALNNQDGLLAITAPAPGRYRLASVRAGYHTTLSDTFTLEEGEIVDMMLDLAHEPVDMGAVVLPEGIPCKAADDDPLGLTVLWREVIKVLSAATWHGQDGLEYYSILYERDVGPEGRLVLGEQTEVGQGLVVPGATYTAGQPFVLIQPDGGATYHPPNAAMILSDEFTRNYCFAGKGAGEAVGLTFQPAATSDQPDVTGTFWIDAETAHLQSIEYRFINVPLRVGADLARGRITFIPGPSGRWLASSWDLQTPLVAMEEGQDPILMGVRHTGGQVAAIMQNDEVVHSAELTELTGVVLDSGGVEPLVGAEVTLVGTDYRARTDEQGRFRIAGPLEGEYGVTFNHPMMDARGFFSPDTTVVLEPGGESTISLRPLAGADYLGGLLGGGAERPRTGEEQVRDYRGRPTNSRNVISQEEIEQVKDLTALEVIGRLRPNWLQNRGAVDWAGSVSIPVAFRNGKLLGELRLLDAIPIEQVGEIWYFNRIDAAQRFGSRYSRAVIEVIDRR